MSSAENLQNAQIALLNLDHALVKIDILCGPSNVVVSTSASFAKADINRVKTRLQDMIFRLEHTQEEDATKSKGQTIGR